MDRNLTLKTLTGLLMILVLNSCASLTGYQDGRSVGEGNGEVGVSLNLSQSPNFGDLEDSIGISDVPTFRFPNIETAGRYGVAEKLDVIFKVNTNLNLGIGAKFQVVGDRSSQFALGIGAEAGTFGLVSGLWNVQIPLYTSFHPKENFSIYASPRYIYQFSTVGDIEGLNYLGGNFGLLFGNKHKFGIDFGYYRVGANDVKSIGITTFGIGGRFRIGNNDPTTTSSRSSTKKRKVSR